MSSTPQASGEAKARQYGAMLECGHVKLDWKAKPKPGWGEWCRECHDFSKVVDFEAAFHRVFLDGFEQFILVPRTPHNGGN